MEAANDTYWRKWLGRLFVGYLRHDPEGMSQVWRESYCGDKFWSLTVGSHTVGVGWLNLNDEG